MSGRVRHLPRSASRPALIVLGVMAAVLVAVAPARGASTPPDVARRGPVGLDTLRRLDRLPFLREGVRTYQVSSADPTGRNDDGFTGRYSCLRRVPGGCLLADHAGPGELDSVWSPGPFFGDVSRVGRLRIELDGRAIVNAPMQSIVDGRMGVPFVAPFVLTTARTPGGFSVNLPMTFRRRMRVIAEKNPGYWHVVYRAFASATGIRTFSRSDDRPFRVPAALRRPGERAPTARTAGSRETRRSFALAPGEQAVIARVDGSAAITALRLRFSRFGPWATGDGASEAAKASDLLQRARLLVRFDGRRTVDAPLGEFFGSGLGPARVRSLLFALDEDPHGWASSWWPMPFRRSAVVTLRNASRTPIRSAEVRVTATPSTRWRTALRPDGDAGYFHAYGRRGATKSGRDWTFLRARGAGTFMGVTQTMAGPDPPYYLEGNERAWIDGSPRPLIQGTGTEDFYLGGWYFYQRTFTEALSGSPVLGSPATGCPRPTCRTAYRLMVADAVPFSRSIRYEIEHGPRNEVKALYGSTAYWYQRAQ